MTYTRDMFKFSKRSFGRYQVQFSEDWSRGHWVATIVTFTSLQNVLRLEDPWQIDFDNLAYVVISRGHYVFND